MLSTNNSSADGRVKNNKRSSLLKAFLSRVALGYQSLEQRFNSSAIYHLLSFFNKKISSIGKFRHTVARMTENSFICNYITGLMGKLLTFPLRSYGIMLFFYGIVTLIVDIIRLFSFRFTSFGTVIFETIFSIILIFSIASFLSASSKSLGNALSGSWIFSRFLTDILCFNIKDVAVDAKMTNNLLFVISGCFLGALTIFIRQQYLLLLGILLIALYIVIKKPESGIILTVLLMPFLTERWLFGCIGIVCCSVIFKSIRNKRVLKIGIVDLFAFLFIFSIFMSGLIGIGHMGGSGAIFKCVILLAFGWIVNNTIKTTVLAEKCVNAFVVSVSVLSTLGIISSVFEIYDLYSMGTVFEAIGDFLRIIPFSSDIKYVHLAILALPFIISQNKRNNPKGLILSLVCILFVVLSFDPSALISLALSFIFYFSFINPVLFLYFGVVISAFAIIYYFFPGLFSAVTHLINSVTDISDYITDISASNSVCAEGIREFMFSGSGLGDSTMNHLMNCLFGNGSDVLLKSSSVYLRLILQVGIIGLVLWMAIYLLSVCNCLSLFYRDKICKDSLKKYVIACLSSCTVMFFAGFYTSGTISLNVFAFSVLMVYLSFSFRKCSEIEFTPEAYDIDHYRDTL